MQRNDNIKCHTPKSRKDINQTIKDNPGTLGEISTRLVNWAKKLDLDSHQKKEFITIIRDLGFYVTWMREVK